MNHAFGHAQPAGEFFPDHGLRVLAHDEMHLVLLDIQLIEQTLGIKGPAKPRLWGNKLFLNSAGNGGQVTPGQGVLELLVCPQRHLSLARRPLSQPFIATLYRNLYRNLYRKPLSQPFRNFIEPIATFIGKPLSQPLSNPLIGNICRTCRSA